MNGRLILSLSNEDHIWRDQFKIQDVQDFGNRISKWWILRMIFTWYLSPSILWATGTRAPSISAQRPGFSPLEQARENSAMKGMAVSTWLSAGVYELAVTLGSVQADMAEPTRKRTDNTEAFIIITCIVSLCRNNGLLNEYSVGGYLQKILGSSLTFTLRFVTSPRL